MRKKIVLLATLTIGFSLYGQQAYWDFGELRNTSSVYGNHTNTGSARFLGMVGAMGALGGDISAAAINPAAVGVSIISDIQGTLGFNSHKNSTSLAGKTSALDQNNTRLAHVGGVITMPLSGSSWKFVNVGVSYSSESLDNEVLSPGNHNIYAPIDWVDNNNQVVHDKLQYDGHRYDRYGDKSKIGISIGGNYDNRIYVGASLNFHNASFDQYDYYQAIYASDGATEIYDKQFSPYSEYGNGFSAAIGVIGKITNSLRLGAAIESPTWWNIDRSYTQYTTVSDTDLTLKSIDTYSEQRNFRAPMKATISAAFIPSKDFAIDVDYTLGFTTPKFTTNSDINADLNSFLKQYAKGQSEVRVGAEYRYEGLRLRAGYSYASNPFDSQTMLAFREDGTTGNQTFDNLYIGSRNTLGVGIGYDFKSFFIDAAYQNVKNNYDNAFAAGDYATYDSNGNGVVLSNEAPIVSSVEEQQNNFFVTLGFRF